MQSWSNDKVRKAITVLKRCASVSEAQSRLGVTGPALRAAFQRARERGFDCGSPGDHIGGARGVGKAPRASVQRQEPGAGRVTKLMVCPDAHHPYVDPLAWATFLEAVRVVRPDVLVIIGDFLDAYAVSSHTKDPGRKANLQWELESAREAVDQLAALGVPRVVYCEGNHETRVSRYIADKAPELYGMINVRELLRIDERGWEWVSYGDWIQIGEVAFTHDVGRCGVNTARQSLQDFGGNLIVGHSHRLQVVYAGTTTGKTHVCLNVGWLGSFESIDYKHQAMARREWTHAFGYCEQTENGETWCTAVPIIDGRCVVAGQIIEAHKAAA